MRTLQLPSGRQMPVLGQGTWRMGADRAQRQAEIEALRLGIELGMTMIDTAEAYASGGAEEVVAEAIAGRRDEVFLVSKVSPDNATRQGTITHCEASLRRLKTDHLDIYLLHWPSAIPFAETLEAFRQLKESGKIRDYGVSNFDVRQMEEARALPCGDIIATNQVLYNLVEREVERDILPWCLEHGVPIQAYTPIGRGRMLAHPALKEIASRHNATPAQIALAWLLQQPNVAAIPKASNPEHVRENRAALDIKLTEEDLAEIDRAFPPQS
ncbi:MAG TPA: aldo/keto reductase [Chloroflexota bacterium]|nr:aldo/keto reductase [Chloroflexota bacterium]